MDKKMNPVGWFEIYVTDLARAEAFYSALFGFEFTDLPVSDKVKMRGFPGDMDGSAMGITGALIKHPSMSPQSGGTIVYFPVDACADAVAKAKTLDAPVHVDVTDIGKYGKFAIIGDSEGNAIGLHSF